MKGKRARLESLEAKRREWEAAHLPLSEVMAFLGDVLSIVQQEAGQEVFQQVAGEMVSQKARRVAALTGGRA